MLGSKKVLINNFFSVGVIQIANYAAPLIIIPVVSRIIGPEKFGVINFSNSFIAYFTLLIGFGFNITATRRIAADPYNQENRNKVFSEVFTAQCLLLLLSVIIFIISLLTVPQLKQEKEVAIFTFITCFATVMTQNWLFQAMQELPKVAILNLVSKALFTISILITIKEESDYIWQPLALSGSHLILAVTSFIWSIKKFNLKLYKVDFSDCSKMLWREKTFFFSLCVISLYTSTNIVVLGIFQNATEVGYYTAAQKLIIIFQSLISLPLSQVLFPYLSKIMKDNKEKGLKTVQNIFPII
jgi:O-antigen/teichoic acid export membrane protein